MCFCEGSFEGGVWDSKVKRVVKSLGQERDNVQECRGFSLPKGCVLFWNWQWLRNKPEGLVRGF